MAGQDFDQLVSSGLLRDVEDIVIGSYRSAEPAASRADAYRWLRYEDPDPVARLEHGVGELVKRGAPIDAEAVDKACAKAAKLGYPNW